MRSREELKEILEQAKEFHVKQVEVDGVKYTLDSQIGFPKLQAVADLKADEIVSPLPAFEEYTDEEILYWSTDYFDELQAKKKAMQEQKNSDMQLKQGGARG